MPRGSEAGAPKMACLPDGGPDRGARRREAGNGLEQRVHIAAAAAERIGQRAEGGQHDPAERHGDIAVAVLQA